MIAVMVSVATFAQVTTSSISGKVTDEKGDALIGATVIALHTPSGTEYGAATNSDGRYTIQGMRTGGPYTVTVSYIGYQTLETTGIMLKLGETTNLSCTLAEGVDIEGVEVVSTAGSRFNATKNGAATNFTSDMIESIPTVSRSVSDIVTMSPLANGAKSGISFAGSNNRYNSFQIDGAVSNDVFGLSATGTNGGTTGSNAVSLDAIEEIQVVVAPFDVRQGGFTGGGINAITKSGTNTFKATAYTYYNNENFYGTTAGKMDEGEERQKASESMTKIFGGTAGGAIIKDKLFAFVSLEKTTQEKPNTFAPGNHDYLSTDIADQILKRYEEATGLKDTYGKHTSTLNESFDVMARIDYNINKNNNLMLRYQYKDAADDKYGNGDDSYSFDGSGYEISNSTQSFVAELNSRISNKVSNEFRAGYTRVRDFRTMGTFGPRVEIKNVDFNDDTQGTVKIGTERYSGANKLNQDVYTITDNVSIYSGAHTITAGTHNEFYKIGNTFIRNSTGTYEYYSLEDFLNDKAGKYEYSYAVDVPNQEFMPMMNAAQFGLYAQDEWKPSDNFTLTAGLRLDLPVIFNQPTVNEEFNNSEYSNNGEYEVGRMPKSRILWSPRVGFRYFTNDSHKSLVRGGAGIFTGRVPFVWMHNAFGNNAIDKKSITIYDDAPALSSTPTTGGVAGKEEINVVSEDFKYPQVFRANLAYEHSFDCGWKVSLEGLYSKTLNNVAFYNAAIEQDGVVYAVSQDAANDKNTIPNYTLANSPYSAIVNLENTNKGYTYNLSAMVEKSFDFGLNLMGAYTFGHAYSVNDGDSSQAYSNWKYQHAMDSNNMDELAFARFDIPHSVKFAASYVSKTYAKNRMYSVVGLTFDGSAGYRYDCIYDDYKVDANGDGYSGNTLLYIPTAAEVDQMTWDSLESKTSFVEWVNGDEYASEHRGEYMERFGALSPFEGHWDLHFAQNFIYNKERGSRFELSLDIMNVGNLLNREWGMYKSSTYGLQPLKITSVTPTADGSGVVPTYSWKGSTRLYDYEFGSRWHMQVGARITF